MTPATAHLIAFDMVRPFSTVRGYSTENTAGFAASFCAMA